MLIFAQKLRGKAEATAATKSYQTMLDREEKTKLNGNWWYSVSYIGKI